MAKLLLAKKVLKMKKVKCFKCLLLPCIVVISSCTPKVNIEITSIPSKAAVFAEDNLIGETPIFITYEYSESAFVDANILKVSPILIRWISGATLIDTPKVDMRNKADLRLNYNRPVNIPGKEIDINYQLKKEENEALESERNLNIRVRNY